MQVRINPGNFADGRKTFEEINYDDPKEFEAERQHIEEVRACVCVCVCVCVCQCMCGRTRSLDHHRHAQQSCTTGRLDA